MVTEKQPSLEFREMQAKADHYLCSIVECVRLLTVERHRWVAASGSWRPEKLAACGREYV